MNKGNDHQLEGVRLFPVQHNTGYSYNYQVEQNAPFLPADYHLVLVHLQISFQVGQLMMNHSGYHLSCHVPLHQTSWRKLCHFPTEVEAQMVGPGIVFKK